MSNRHSLYSASPYNYYDPLSWTRRHHTTHTTHTFPPYLHPSIHHAPQAAFLPLPLSLPRDPCQIYPIFPHPFSAPSAPAAPLPFPSPYYLTQLHLSRPPSIPNPFPPVPPPLAPRTPSQSFIIWTSPHLRTIANTILTIFGTLPILGMYLYTEIQPLLAYVVRKVRGVDWVAVGITWVVFCCLSQGLESREPQGLGTQGQSRMLRGNGNGMGDRVMNREVDGMEPAYIIALANCRSMRGLLRAGGKGELVVV